MFEVQQGRRFLSEISCASLDHAAKKPKSVPGGLRLRRSPHDSRRQARRAKASLAAKAKAEIESSGKSDKPMKLAGPYVYDAISGKIEGDAPKVDLTDGS